MAGARPPSRSPAPPRGMCQMTDLGYASVYQGLREVLRLAPARARAFRGPREFLRLEAPGGIVLGAAAALALIACNSGLVDFYRSVLILPVELRFGALQLAKPLLLCSNERRR